MMEEETVRELHKLTWHVTARIGIDTEDRIVYASYLHHGRKGGALRELNKLLAKSYVARFDGVPCRHDTRQAAVSLAGRALLNYLLGRSFVCMALYLDEQGVCMGTSRRRLSWVGEIVFHRKGSPTSLASVSDAIMADMAGYIAQLLDDKARIGTARLRPDDAKYLDQARGVCLGEEEVTAYLCWLRLRTKALLAQPENWRAVQEITSALLQSHYLSGEECVSIITKALLTVTAEA